MGRRWYLLEWDGNKRGQGGDNDPSAVQLCMTLSDITLKNNQKYCYTVKSN